MKKVIGYEIIVSIFAAIFGVSAASMGVLQAIGAFAATAVMVLLVFLACYLIDA